MDTSTFSPESLNPLLEERLRLLKGERVDTRADNARVEQTVNFLNDILYQAIIHHAPHFNAVRVEALIDLDKDRRYLGESGINSGALGHFTKNVAGGEATGRRMLNFTLHLPYLGSEEYFNRNEALTVGFGQGIRRQDAYAHLKIDLREGYGPTASKPVRLSLDEIASVNLVLAEDSEFSPYCITDNRPLQPSPSPLMHYLRFRNFRPDDIQNEIRKIEDPEIRSRVENLAGDIWTPGDTLLDVHQDRTQPCINGFAAVNEGGNLKLYEFSYHTFQKIGDDKWVPQIIYVADAIARHNATPLNNVRVYTGHEAVKRIHEAFQLKQGK